MGTPELRAEWCFDPHTRLQQDAVTIHFGREPGILYRLDRSTGYLVRIDPCVPDADNEAMIGTLEQTRALWANWRPPRRADVTLPKGTAGRAALRQVARRLVQ